MKKTKIIKWVARIWSLPIIAYSLMMAIGYTVNYIQTGKADPNALESYPFIENLPPIFMFIAVIGLALAWKWEKVGASINILFSLATLPILLIHWPLTEDPRNAVPYILVAVIVTPAILHLVNRRK